jgi:hypothetical protein
MEELAGTTYRPRRSREAVPGPTTAPVACRTLLCMNKKITIAGLVAGTVGTVRSYRAVSV